VQRTPITVAAALDQSGFNTGNLTAAFTAAVLGDLTVPFFELYHAAVQNVPGGASAVIGFSPSQAWGFTAPGVGGGAEYHLSGNGWLLTPAREFFFFFNTATATPAIKVTCWFRYDQDIAANLANQGQK
jgi:hypothetical protein